MSYIAVCHNKQRTIIVIKQDMTKPSLDGSSNYTVKCKHLGFTVETSQLIYQVGYHLVQHHNVNIIIQVYLTSSIIYCRRCLAQVDLGIQTRVILIQSNSKLLYYVWSYIIISNKDMPTDWVLTLTDVHFYFRCRTCKGDLDSQAGDSLKIAVE